MRYKICKFIFDKYVVQGALTINLGLNRNETADYLNVSRPSMSREMMRLRDEGIFDFHMQTIFIKNLSLLKHYAEGNVRYYGND